MRKTTVMILVLLLMGSVCVAGASFAGNGRGAGMGAGGGGNGPGGGTGPIHNILSGTPFSADGTVVSIVPGEGMELVTDAEETLTIYGIGPVWYWENLGIERPAVGDDIHVEGYIVNFNLVERYIAMTITVGGKLVQLRDPDTGEPLWRRNGQGGK